MSAATTVSRSVTDKNVKSVIEAHKSVFLVTSYFDSRANLSDVLFSAVNDDLFKNPFLGSDLGQPISYTKGED